MGSCRTIHTAQMVAFEVINARECTLTDVTAEGLVCRVHGGPPGRRGISGVRRESNVVCGGKDECIDISMKSAERMYRLGFVRVNKYLTVLPVRYGMVSPLRSPNVHPSMDVPNVNIPLIPTLDTILLIYQDISISPLLKVLIQFTP